MERKVVEEMYRDTLLEMLGASRKLTFNRLGWVDDDACRLALVLPPLFGRQSIIIIVEVKGLNFRIALAVNALLGRSSLLIEQPSSLLKSSLSIVQMFLPQVWWKRTLCIKRWLQSLGSAMVTEELLCCSAKANMLRTPRL